MAELAGDARLREIARVMFPGPKERSAVMRFGRAMMRAGVDGEIVCQCLMELSRAATLAGQRTLPGMEELRAAERAAYRDTAFPNELTNSMNAVLAIGKRAEPVSERVEALERHRRFVDRVRALVEQDGGVKGDPASG